MLNRGSQYGVGELKLKETASVYSFGLLEKKKEASVHERVSQGFTLLKEVYSGIDSELVYDIFEANNFDIIKAAEILDDLNQW